MRKIGAVARKAELFRKNSLPAREEEIFMIRRPDKQRTSVLHVIDEVSPWDGQVSPNRLSNLTIVVVEDHDDSRRFVGLFLDRLGATVVLARNGFEGLEATRNSRPNVVVSDIQKPGMNGFELRRSCCTTGQISPESKSESW